jgi:uncharacterized membrane protein
MDGILGGPGFLGVDWGMFVVVFLAAFAASVVVVCAYAVGLRLLATGASTKERSLPATAAAGLCFAVAGAAVLYGLWLIIPQFH